MRGASAIGATRPRDEATRDARRNGRSLGHLPYYMAPAFWKLAAIVEGAHAHFVARRTDDPDGAALDHDGDAPARHPGLLPDSSAVELPFDPIEEARRHWEEHWDKEAATEMVAVTSIMRAHQILISRLNELLDPYGLTFPRYEALMLLFLSRRGSLPLGKIGERLQVHRTSVTNTIDGLEKLGLVRRVPHKSDRRAMLAEIQPKGRRIAGQATKTLNGAGFAIDSLSERKLKNLSKILRDLRLDAEDFPA